MSSPIEALYRRLGLPSLSAGFDSPYHEHPSDSVPGAHADTDLYGNVIYAQSTITIGPAGEVIISGEGSNGTIRITGTSAYLSIGATPPTAYDTAGIWAGLVAGQEKLSIVGGGSSKLTWDGTTLTIVGAITATTGTLTTLTVDGTITLGTGGVIQTASSGKRIDLSAAGNDRMNLYSGDTLEDGQAYVNVGVYGAGATRYIRMDLRGARTTVGTPSGGMAILLASETADDSTIPPTVYVVYQGDSSQTPEMKIQNGIIVLGEDGAESAPSRSYNNDTGLGAYRVGSGEEGWSSGGSRVAGYRAAGITSIGLGLEELAADPSNPAEGRAVFWQSDGTGTGDDGDILIKITAGGVTKTTTLIDYSTL